MKSCAVPSATMHCGSASWMSFVLTATVTFLIGVNISSCSPSVIIAHLPLSFAILMICAGSASRQLMVRLCSCAADLAWPIYLSSDPNSYFSKRSATSGAYSHVTAISPVGTSICMSVFIVTSSWLISTWPRAFSKASRCLGVSSSRWL